MGEDAQSKKQMFKGNWQCSECGGSITELPFQPKGEQNLTCKQCYMKSRPQGSGGAPKKMVSGNWKCSDCGDEIKELPFTPSGDRPLYCRNCFKKNR